MTTVRRHRLWSLALLALAIVAVAAGAWWTATGAPTPALTATVGGGVAAVAHRQVGVIDAQLRGFGALEVAV